MSRMSFEDRVICQVVSSSRLTGGCALNDTMDKTLSTSASMLATELSVEFGLGISTGLGLSTISDYISIIPVFSDNELDTTIGRFVNDERYVKVSKVRNFCARAGFACELLYLPVLNNCVIVYRSTAHPVTAYHLMQVALPVALQKMFNVELTQFCKKLVDALIYTDSSKYLALVAEFVIDHRYDETRIRQLVDGFETSGLSSRINALQRTIDALHNTLLDYDNKMQKVVKDIRENEELLTGLQYLKKDSDDSELADYLIANKAISIVRRDQSKLVYDVTGFIEYYDDNLAEIVVNSSATYHNVLDVNKDNVRKLMKALFVDKRASIRVISGFTLDSDLGVSTRTPSYVPVDAIQNPHIQHFGCIGSFRQVFNELMQKRDFIMIFEECIASTSTLNFADGTVINRFVADDLTDLLRSDDIKPFVLKNGDSVSAKELLKIIEEGNDEQTH